MAAAKEAGIKAMPRLLERRPPGAKQVDKWVKVFKDLSSQPSSATSSTRTAATCSTSRTPSRRRRRPRSTSRTLIVFRGARAWRQADRGQGAAMGALGRRRSELKASAAHRAAAAAPGGDAERRHLVPPALLADRPTRARTRADGVGAEGERPARGGHWSALAGGAYAAADVVGDRGDYARRRGRGGLGAERRSDGLHPPLLAPPHARRLKREVEQRPGANVQPAPRRARPRAAARLITSSSSSSAPGAQSGGNSW